MEAQYRPPQQFLNRMADVIFHATDNDNYISALSSSSVAYPESLPLRESYVDFSSEDISLRIGLKLESGVAYAGGPIAASLLIENKGTKTVYVAIGMAGGRPAYVSFAAELAEQGFALNDPTGIDPLALQGVMSAIEITPGETSSIRLVLNQFLTTEDLISALALGESEFLNIDWQSMLAIGLSVEQAIAQTHNLPVVEGQVCLPITRDDEHLDDVLRQLTNEIKEDWTVVSERPVERSQNLSMLTSLRIPAVIPYLQSIAEHPSYEIRLYVQRALEETAKNVTEPEDNI